MEASYYIKGQHPNSAIYEIHNPGVKFSDEDLIPDFPWLASPDVPASDKAVFILACAAQVASVEALRYGLISEKVARHQVTVAKKVKADMEGRWADTRTR